MPTILILLALLFSGDIPATLEQIDRVLTEQLGYTFPSSLYHGPVITPPFKADEITVAPPMADPRAPR